MEVLSYNLTAGVETHVCRLTTGGGWGGGATEMMTLLISALYQNEYKVIKYFINSFH